MSSKVTLSTPRIVQIFATATSPNDIQTFCIDEYGRAWKLRKPTLEWRYAKNERGEPEPTCAPPNLAEVVEPERWVKLPDLPED